jgi:hypothetical protein
MVFGCIAIGTQYWFEISVTGYSQNIGLFQTCVSDKCVDNDYSDSTCVSGEKRSGTELKARMDAVKAMTILGLAFSFGGAVTSGVCYKTANKVLYYVTVVLLVLSTATYGAGDVLFVQTIDDWLNCSREYCSGRGCSERFGYSFALAATALALAFVNVFIAACAGRADDTPQPVVLQQTNPIRPIQEQKAQEQQMMHRPSYPGPAPAAATNVPATYNPAPEPVVTSRAATVAATPAPARANTTAGGVALDDEWQFDASSNLYWSDLQQLYLDPNSNQYYDPASEQWYNPETGEWYVA